MGTKNNLFLKLDLKLNLLDQMSHLSSMAVPMTLMAICDERGKRIAL